MIRNEVDDSMYIIAGLGNPTSQYDKTRHNVGFDAIDKVAEKHGISLNMKKYHGIYGTGVINGEKVLLVKPQTYMNLSGECIIEFLNFYKLDPEQELIVLYDDISLAPGNIRIRKKGSAGGHNGIKNIIAHLGHDKFVRVKIGVGEKPPGYDLADFVLGRFSQSERQEVEEALERTEEAVEGIIGEGAETAMNLYNKKVVK